jgi:hypothetical protein
VDRQPTERIVRARETLEALRRVDPRRNPSVEDIANLHEVHARHEREAGREDRAAAAEERARRTREGLADRAAMSAVREPRTRD